MSDTKITAEERALWASVATARINAVTPERQCEITAQERLVNALKALEQAEARAEEAEAMVDWLADVLHKQDPHRFDIEYWKRNARLAVAAGEG